MRLQALVSEGVSGICPPAHVQSEHFIESTDVYEEMHMSLDLTERERVKKRIESKKRGED